MIGIIPPSLVLPNIHGYIFRWQGMILKCVTINQVVPGSRFSTVILLESRLDDVMLFQGAASTPKTLKVVVCEQMS